ncbi:NAD(P)/FAD-dependent oxidoreductase [Gluconacetobacter azotocaptans]|uniref:NAD(P)/FAD-dependent oxidoreductase n=1 Tax=Gluconacetobacter azotocaptans TaxID=142834 RepID=A0A7W4JRI0_9PROT|nr:NAD(P)/FAD-dependent oxidoreductase [Gluconacetobacter azotocaptans]MBB2189574.1 NAD(P)/FAD-dependent oxidoreductase [Gluconacetobacter azotocaptans]MBM9403547.1 NAD(P)/FAD-dependent oxidoreductase [Gluconacetobacter azotocaptans]GBQ33693.1 glutathione reductase [Gluconacetobacter azotocaptans DSM 13594]
MTRPIETDVIVLGAGAAGLMAALTAGQRGRRVTVLDHAAEAGRKILISGGGRCNFTNRDTDAGCFLSGNPHFAKSALARFRPADILALVERHRIAWHEKTLGQLFCDGSARAVVEMLRAECDAGSVDLRLAHRITGVTKADCFTVATDRATFSAPALVLATGGLSIPKMGATGLSHDIARQFGLRVTPTTPALVPLTFDAATGEWMRDLAGVSVNVEARCGRARFREALLFTHRGLSGPAILQASSYWQAGGELCLDLLPGRDAAGLLRAAKRQRPRVAGQTMLGGLLPQRLAQMLAAHHLPDGPVGEMPDAVLNRLGQLLSRWVLTPTGTEGYAKAEVTRGGIDTRDLSSATMEARGVPGLYAVGEAVDVTGWLGGYNFQWAWASGHAAGRALAEPG